MKQMLSLTLVVAVAGCSSSNSSASGGTSAPAAAATTSSAPAAPAAMSLDVYPGATKLPTQMRDPITFCGTKMTTIVYNVANANAATVAAWYASRIQGAIRVTMPVSEEDVVEVFEPDGHAAAAISQMHFDPRLAGAAKTLGADRTILGLVTFEPPMSPDTIEVVRAAANGDASAKARIKAQCAGRDQ